MRIRSNRIWTRCVFVFGFVTVLVIVYVIGLKQNTQRDSNSRVHDAESQKNKVEMVVDDTSALTAEMKEKKQKNVFMVEDPPAHMPEMREKKQMNVFMVEDPPAHMPAMREKKQMDVFMVEDPPAHMPAMREKKQKNVFMVEDPPAHMPAMREKKQMDVFMVEDPPAHMPAMREKKQKNLFMVEDPPAHMPAMREKKQKNVFMVEDPPAHMPAMREKKQMDVFVVEEHHEVVPYWFSAAEKGVIPKSGNTLIHIDGHSDMAPVMYIPGYPLFKWPTMEQLQYLMQRNDGFIQSSSMAGLVSRIIWVWPNWDWENHGNGYATSNYSLGWTNITDKDNPLEKAFCFCNEYQNISECYSLTDVDGTGGDTNINDTEDGQEPFAFLLSSDKCHIKKILIVEEVEERRALTYFGKKDWVTASENVILDIDEDYYGCTYAVEPLLKVNMSMTMVDRISQTLGDFLCPGTMIQEKESETILLDIITLIRKQKQCKSKPNLRNSKECPQTILKTGFSKAFKQLLNNAIEQNKINICAHKNLSVSGFVNKLLADFNKINIQQLDALKTVGFCLSTSIKTMDLFDDRRFQLCIGHNTPNHTAVTEHKPTHSDIQYRSMLLKLILNKVKPFSPKLVTVCRSVRDGYTPRHFFEKIEKDILTALTRFLNKNLKVHYDDGLLGGKPGWPHGHNNGTY